MPLSAPPPPVVNNDNFIRSNMKNRGGSCKASRPTSSLAAKMKRRKSIGIRREQSREQDRNTAMANVVHGRHNSYTDNSNSTLQGLQHGGNGILGQGHVSYNTDHSLSLSLSHTCTHSLTHSLTHSFQLSYSLITYDKLICYYSLSLLRSQRSHMVAVRVWV